MFGQLLHQVVSGHVRAAGDVGGGRLLGKHVLLPAAGTINMIDTVEEKVYVDRTKDQIKDAPEFDEAKHSGKPTYREQFSRYYNMPHM
ncbi:hypothetical protein [Streptomyces sp. NPDC054797]